MPSKAGLSRSPLPPLAIFAQKDAEFTDKRTVDALETQTRALDMAFLLHGSYAPRDPKAAAQYDLRTFFDDYAAALSQIEFPERLSL